MDERLLLAFRIVPARQLFEHRSGTGIPDQEPGVMNA
jgi:hypothetical protein